MKINKKLIAMIISFPLIIVLSFYVGYSVCSNKNSKDYDSRTQASRDLIISATSGLNESEITNFYNSTSPIFQQSLSSNDFTSQVKSLRDNEIVSTEVFQGSIDTIITYDLKSKNDKTKSATISTTKEGNEWKISNIIIQDI
jgi:hypothetical protein